MSKLTILKGLPGSGKSTKAKEIVAATRKTVRVNKDLLREMLHFGGFNADDERSIVELEYKMVEDFLAKGFNVVVDDTNFNPKHERTYRETAEPIHEVEVIMMKTPVDECIKRDAERAARGERSVGRDTIVNMAMQAKLLKQEQPCAVFDLDGTLANIEHRRHYVNVPKDQKKDWDGFFKEIPADSPRLDIITHVNEHKARGEEIIICSGRPEDYRVETIAWLKKHNVHYDRLIMRRHRDCRPDTTVKKEMLEKFLDRSKITTVYDDRPVVIREVWVKAGLKVVDVGDGKEF